MTISGIEDIVKFCNFLKSKRIFYAIFHFTDESLTVCLTLLEHRIEVYFFEKHIEYSIFSGDESVIDDQNELFDIISRYKD